MTDLILVVDNTLKETSFNSFWVFFQDSIALYLIEFVPYMLVLYEDILTLLCEDQEIL